MASSFHGFRWWISLKGLPKQVFNSFLKVTSKGCRWIAGSNWCYSWRVTTKKAQFFVFSPQVSCGVSILNCPAWDEQVGWADLVGSRRFARNQAPKPFRTMHTKFIVKNNTTDILKCTYISYKGRGKKHSFPTTAAPLDAGITRLLCMET